MCSHRIALCSGAAKFRSSALPLPLHSSHRSSRYHHRAGDRRPYLPVSRRLLAQGECSALGHMVHQMISRALKMAVRRRIIGVNVASFIDSPKHRESEFEPLPREDAQAMLRVAADMRNGARWSVAFGLGLRQSEALGMRWQFVNLDEGTIRVYQLKRRRFEHGCADPYACGAKYHTANCIAAYTRHGRHCPERIGGEWRFREPKGGKTRFIPIPHR